MPIVRYEVALGSVQADGGHNVTLDMFDQDSNMYREGFYAPPGFDVTAKATARQADLTEQLARDEFAALIGL